ncbi:hypothetical protein CULT_1670011 [[Clostridium] ultunense Esp]|nr:hypothetical protein CULT_1670011 [[Clostridium] ultunense Esp]
MNAEEKGLDQKGKMNENDIEDITTLDLEPDEVPAYALSYVKNGPLNNVEFGKWLKALREEKGLTLAELGEKTGYSTAYLSQVENGKKRNMPTPEYLKKMAIHLGVKYSELLHMAGYEDMANGIKLKELEKEFKNKFGGLLEFANRLTPDDIRKHARTIELFLLIEHVTDLRHFLMDNYNSKTGNESIAPKYNGRYLSTDDRMRAIQVLDALFHEYVIPKEKKGSEE